MLVQPTQNIYIVCVWQVYLIGYGYDINVLCILSMLLPLAEATNAIAAAEAWVHCFPLEKCYKVWIYIPYTSSVIWGNPCHFHAY